MIVSLFALSARKNTMFYGIGFASVSALLLFPTGGAFAQHEPQQIVNEAQSQRDSAAIRALLSRRVSLQLDGMALNDAVRAAASAAKVRMLFNEQYFESYKQTVTLKLSNVSLAEAFERILAGTNLYVTPSSPTLLVLRRKDSVSMRQTADSTASQSQEAGIIVGRVIDSATQQGIPGVTILVNGTKVATTTIEDGSFRVNGVPAKAQTLVVRLIGYESRTVPVTFDSGKVARMLIRLQQGSTTLTEVVTTATGSQRRAEISNDVVTIDADRVIETAPVRSVTDLLVAAQVPGLIVTPSSGEPGAPARLRFGGVGSISQNNDPVVIVDGVWIKSAFSDTSLQRTLISGSTNGLLPSRLDAIDPSSIETIEIVRGPAAAALYGPDAANGVIKITTKRGRPGPARWDFRFVRDQTSPLKNKPVNYLGYGHTLSTSTPTECSLNSFIQGTCTFDSLAVVNPNSPLFLREGNGSVTGLTASVNGGTNQIRYNLTGSMQDQVGVRRLSGLDRIRLRQLDLPVSGQFRQPSRLRDRTISSSLTIAPMQTLEFMVNFSGTQRNSDENSLKLSEQGGSIDPRDTLMTMLRQFSTESRRNSTTTTQGMLSLFANWTPRPWWSGNFTVGLDRGYTRENSRIGGNSCLYGVCAPMSEIIEDADRQYSIYTVRGQSTLMPNLGWASRFLVIRPGLTVDFRREIRNSMQVAVSGSAPASARRSEGPTTALGGIGLNMYIRLFDRLSFDPAFRRDFGTRMISRNNAKTYPRFGTSWIVSDESFFPKNPWITSLRLRAALGYAAVQPDLSAIYGRYVNNTTVINGQTVPMVTFHTIGNTQLEPERSFEIESGFDMDLFEDRATLIVTHSNKRNQNTLINRFLPPSAGTQGRRQENLARVVNRRTDIQLTARVIERREFTARITANFSIYDNILKSLGDGVSPFGTNEQRYVEGYPIGGLWVRPILGVNDLNNNGLLEDGEYAFADSVVYVGSPLPRYTAGYNIELGVLGMFTVNALVNYKGRYMQNRSAKFENMIGYWDPSSSLADQGLVEVLQTTKADRQNVSEVRLQSASITMNVPSQYLRALRARSLQISLQGSNLGMWTQYRGRDPGVNSTPIGERITDDGLGIASPRAFSLQVRLGY